MRKAFETVEAVFKRQRKNAKKTFLIFLIVIAEPALLLPTLCEPHMRPDRHRHAHGLHQLQRQLLTSPRVHLFPL